MIFDHFYVPLIYVSAYSVVIPLFCGSRKFKTLGKIQRVLFKFCITCLLTEIANLALRKGHENALQAVQNLFTLFEYAFLFYIYYLEFHSRPIRVFIIILSLISLGLFIVNFYDPNLFWERNDFMTSIESVFMLALSVTFLFYRLNSKVSSPGLSDDYFFWINTAFSLYFATAFVIFLSNDYLTLHVNDFKFYHSIQRLINISANCMFGIALWKPART